MFGPKTAARLERHLTALGVPHDVKTYDQAGHSFFSEVDGWQGWLARVPTPMAVGYDEAAARDGWDACSASSMSTCAEAGASAQFGRVCRLRRTGRPRGVAGRMSDSSANVDMGGQMTLAAAVRLVMSGSGRLRLRVGLRLFGALVLVAWAALAAPAARAAVTPEQDPFYKYEGSTALKRIAPGTVLKTRTVSFHIAEIPLPITAVQLLYRSTSELGNPTVNVTSVLLPPVPLVSPTVLSYQSFYDSLSTEDDPSYAISGGFSMGGEIPQAESVLIAPALLAGETVVVPDTEGEEADFSAGPVYGYNTLDSLRAALSSPATGLTANTKIGLAGYSGGAIATEWAAQLHPPTPPKSTGTSSAQRWAGCLSTPRTT